MRNLLAAAAVTCLLAGCPPTDDPDVSAWYRRGSEDVVFCTNGAFSAVFTSGPLEGLWTDGPASATPSLVATLGATNAPAFTLTYRAAISWGSAEIGEDWVPTGVDEDQRDALHARCAALETQPWWH